MQRAQHERRADGDVGRSVSSVAARPLGDFLDALARKGCAPRRFGEGWTARCPGPEHEPGDAHRHLFVAEAEDGCVILHCFGKEDAEEILRAAGVQEAPQ